MSTVMVIAPLVIANWSAISAAVVGAVGVLGFSTVNEAVEASRRVTGTNRAEIELDESEILEGTGGSGEQIVVERDDVRAIFTRDARGALKVCVEGHGHTKSELKQIGEELIGRVTQQYVYHRVVTELSSRNMAIIDEEVTEDRTVKIRVRNW
ncbi:MAG: hypothetical protein AABP62_16850 [Planctomycetota bacterium]